ncbi:hypothetical protein GTW25_19430 [Aliihoeflea aestuarii]|uniref:glycosyltransferase family 8 protein n=1 Tax=Aliihoeflea aestuarii TaxID=453840 RepID=UPI0027E31659|nr:glycosyltransferase [Aliihoeflea aestuarii]MCO6393196.1 hypothetical protein [Aliihoeflea aestuarii]
MMHVVCAADRAFLRHVPVMLSSLTAHSSTPLRVSVVGMDWNDRDKRCIEAALPDLAIEFLSPPLSVLEGLSHKAMLSPMAYARILMAELVDSDRFLYLDIDMIVRSDVAELWATELGSSPAAAVFHDDKLNSGLLLVNARVWRERELTAQILEWARVHRPREADQESIEAVIGPEIQRLDPRWNRLVDPFWSAQALATPQYRENARILHFITGFKPWNLGRWFLSKAYVDEWRRFRKPTGLPVIWAYEIKTLLWQIQMLFRLWLKR